MTGRKALMAWLAVHMALLPAGDDRTKALTDWAGLGLKHEHAGLIGVKKDED
jgi:hypothetical protein